MGILLSFLFSLTEDKSYRKPIPALFHPTLKNLVALKTIGSIRKLMFFSLLLYSCVVNKSRAQDTLVFLNKSKVPCLVTEVGYTEIKYRLEDDEETERYCSRHQLVMIIYRNGSREIFNPEIVAAQPKKPEKLYHHDISLNTLGLLSVQLAFLYQFTFQKAGISLMLPFQFMLLKKPILDGTEQLELGRKNYNLGIGLSFHKRKQNHFTYFGPLFRTVNQSVKSSYWILDYKGMPYYYVQQSEMISYDGYFTLGQYSTNKHFSLNTFASVGLRYTEFSNYMYVPFTDDIIKPEIYPWSLAIYAGVCIGFGF